jgi:hypothetical protein
MSVMLRNKRTWSLLTETSEDKLRFKKLFLYYEYVQCLRNCSFLNSRSDFVDTLYTAIIPLSTIFIYLKVLI